MIILALSGLHPCLFPYFPHYERKTVKVLLLIFFLSLQIWRPLTALFFYPISPSTGFHFLINCYFLYNYSQRLETGMFAGKPADYFYMLLFNWACCVIIGLLVNLPVSILKKEHSHNLFSAE